MILPEPVVDARLTGGDCFPMMKVSRRGCTNPFTTEETEIAEITLQRVSCVLSVSSVVNNSILCALPILNVFPA